MESAAAGQINCPKCRAGITVAELGCNLITCRDAHGQDGWFYFCYHCRRELPGGIQCAACPSRNNAETRQQQQAQRNADASGNPVDVQDDDDEADDEDDDYEDEDDEADEDDEEDDDSDYDGF
jgi:hypothetical protein